MTDFIASRELVAERKSGERFSISVGVGIPKKSEKPDSWVCSAKLDVLRENVADIPGIDSWQAVKLAQKFVVGQLKFFIEDGGSLYLFGENKPASLQQLDELF